MQQVYITLTYHCSTTKSLHILYTVSTFCTKQHHILQWRMQGADHGERAAHRERRSGAERGPGAEPLVGVKLKAFCQFLYKKVAKT